MNELGKGWTMRTRQRTCAMLSLFISLALFPSRLRSRHPQHETRGAISGAKHAAS